MQRLEEVAASAALGRLSDWAEGEDGPLDTLTRRVMHETRWPQAYARRVAGEYRRFLVLAIVRQGEVSPSEAVDRFWHAHILDTRAYFDDFCPRVLGFVLHHRPGVITGEPTPPEAACYAETLAAYEALFDEAPSGDVWPSLSARLAPAAASGRRMGGRRIPLLPRLRASALLLLCTGAAHAMAPLSPRESFLAGYFLTGLALLGACVGSILSSRRARVAEVPRDHELELAYVAGGAARAVETALVGLVQGRHVQLGRRGRWTPGPATDGPRDALGGTLRQLLLSHRPMSEWWAALAPALDALHARTHRYGWVLGAERDVHPAPHAMYLLAAFGIWMAVGAVRLLSGMTAHAPVVGLVVCMTAGTAAAFWVLGLSAESPTLRGQRACKSALSRLPPQERFELGDADLMLAAALKGMPVLGASLAYVVRLGLALSASRGAGSSDQGSESASDAVRDMNDARDSSSHSAGTGGSSGFGGFCGGGARD